MATAKKSTSKKTTKKTAMTAPMMDTPVMDAKPSTQKPKISPKVTGAALLIVIIALITYKFGPWFVPAVVDGKPITRFGIWTRMEKSYGAQTLDDMVNEVILDKAIEKSGVTVEQADIDAQLSSLEKQFESLGGLDAALSQRGLTKDELKKQVVTQLSVEKILADKINVSDEAVQKDYDDNKDTLYKDKKFDDVKDTIKSTLKDSMLRDGFLEWFAGVKKDAQVKNFGL